MTDFYWPDFYIYFMQIMIEEQEVIIISNR